jgi:hypothetical protein
MKQSKRKSADFIVIAPIRRKPTPEMSGLLILLNTEDFGEPTGPLENLVPMSAEQTLQTFQALRSLRPHLIDLLTPIADPYPMEKHASQYLRVLIGEINRRGLRAGFRLVNGTVHQDFFPPSNQGAAQSMVSSIYSSVATTLVSGELKLLRRCPHCGKFFLALKDPRARFCPGRPGHARLYYDEPSRARDRVYKSRSK